MRAKRFPPHLGNLNKTALNIPKFSHKDLLSLLQLQRMGSMKHFAEQNDKSGMGDSFVPVNYTA